MGKGKRLRNSRSNMQRKGKVPKAVVVHVTYQEAELVACKTEKELDKLFNEKVEIAMSNFKVEVKQFFGFLKKQPTEAEVKKLGDAIIEANEHEYTNVSQPE